MVKRRAKCLCLTCNGVGVCGAEDDGDATGLWLQTHFI
jgi:hypothetical protein